ncbi:MAG: ChuX/HutX family heme-like substrate-binding protein [Taibaiella sp.]|jgi:putative hemin transport protein
MSTATISLKEQWEQLKTENPKLRIRDAAKQLGVSEAELLATGVGHNVTKLEGDWKAFLVEVAALGKVMALTRNDDAVHERKGIYNNITFQGPVGTALNEDIDLRLFMMNWGNGYAVNENDRLSFQFFDKSGEATHKIYCTDDSNVEAYQELTKKYTAAEQTSIVEVTPNPAKAAEKADSEIDVPAFQEAWQGIKDTHEFFGMLAKYGVGRHQAMRLAPQGFVKQVDNNIIRTMLTGASERNVPIMVFVANRGCIQIHTGEVKKVVEAGPWFNVLDPDFNLHVKESAITYSYVVKKPSVDGIITSIEIYDGKGEMIVQFFGKRKPGIPELTEWRQLVQYLTQF